MTKKNDVDGVKKALPQANENQLNKMRADIFSQQLEEERQDRLDGGKSFVREDDGQSADSFATEMGKDFLIAAETGREVLEELSDEQMPEENGGPFVVTNDGAEFAEGVDKSNPKTSTREPFPAPMRKP